MEQVRLSGCIPVRRCWLKNFMVILIVMMIMMMTILMMIMMKDKPRLTSTQYSDQILLENTQYTFYAPNPPLHHNFYHLIILLGKNLPAGHLHRHHHDRLHSIRQFYDATLLPIRLLNRQSVILFGIFFLWGPPLSIATLSCHAISEYMICSTISSSIETEIIKLHFHRQEHVETCSWLSWLLAST